MKCYCCGKSVERTATLPTVAQYPNGKPVRICKECDRAFERKEFEARVSHPEPCPNCDNDMADGACTVCCHKDSFTCDCQCEWCREDDEWWDEDDEWDD